MRRGQVLRSRISHDLAPVSGRAFCWKDVPAFRLRGFAVAAAIVAAGLTGWSAPAYNQPSTGGPPMFTGSQGPTYSKSFVRAWAGARDSREQGRGLQRGVAWTRNQIDVISFRPERATYSVTLDRARQVLRLDVPEEKSYDSAMTEIHSSLSGCLEGFVPAAALGVKAKQFDDGLYAAVEYAVTEGAGRFMSRRNLLERVAAALPPDSPPGAAGLLAAASSVGGEALSVPRAAQDLAVRLERAFLAEPLRSKPVGFYTWNEQLSRAFRRDRMLQTPIGDPGEVAALVRALAADADARRSYEAAIALNERLTNPMAAPDLRRAIEDHAAGRKPAGGVAFLPPSLSHETELVKEMFGNKPVPDGFNLADEMVARIRDGRLELKPDERSGWYDYQAWALEPLAALERVPERQHLEPTAAYRAELVELFKSLLALTRETHVKQLEVPLAGAAGPRPETRIELVIQPRLTVEPLPSYYRRRAEGYVFVRRVLEDAFGAASLAGMHRQTADGPVNLTLDEELSLMEALTAGAYLQSCRETGQAPEEIAGSRWTRMPGAAVAVFDAWALEVDDDPDLGTDLRMMVPVFYDVGRGKTKVWAVLGVASRPLSVGFATVPVVEEVRDAAGRLVDLARVKVEFSGEFRTLAYIVSVEAYVDRILDRDEFRRHCDRYKTFQAIVANLQ